MIKPRPPKEYALVTLIYLAVAYLVWSVLESWLRVDIWTNFDNRNYHPDMIAYGMNRLLQGEWPLWNPYQGAGIPFFAALQGMVLYPPTWLALVFSAETTHVLSKYLHLAVSGISIYFYLRTLRLHPLASFLGGLFFMTGNFYLVFTVFETAAYPLATVGFLLGAVERILQTSSKLGDTVANRWSLIFVIVLTLEVFAGYIQTVVFIGYFLCLYIPFRIGQLFFQNRSTSVILTPFFRFGAMALLTLMLASVQLVPAVEMSINSATHNLNKGMDMSYVSLSLLPSPSILETLNDSVIPIPQTPWDIAFWSFIAIGLLFYKQLRPLVLFYILTSALFLTLARSTETVLYELYYNYIPTGAWFRWPEKFLLMSNLTISILVGIGLNRCHQFLSRHKHWPINYAFWLYCFGLFSVAFLSRYSSNGIEAAPQDWHWQAFGKQYAPYQASNIVDDVNHLLENPAQFRIYSGNPHIDAEPALNFLKQNSKQERIFSLLNIEWDFVPDLPVKWATRERLYSIEDYEPLMAARFKDFARQMGAAMFFHVMLPKDLKMMSLFGTRWLLVSRDWEQRFTGAKLPADLDIVYADPNFKIYQFPQSLPRAYVASGITKIPESNILDYLSSAAFDPLTDVVVNESASVHSSNDNSHITSANIVDYQAEKVVIELAKGGRSGLLVLTDNYDKNWRVTVDGKEAELIPVNYNFRGVEVTPESHRIVFSYRPTYFYLGAAISFSAILMIIAFQLETKRRASRREPHQ